MMCLIFETEEDCNNSLDYIKNIAGYPRTATNARSGKEEPDKQKTERWSDKPKQRKDGKYFFPRLTKYWRDKQPKEKSDAFKAKHKFSIEEYSDNWVDQPEEF